MKALLMFNTVKIPNLGVNNKFAWLSDWKWLMGKNGVGSRQYSNCCDWPSTTQESQKSQVEQTYYVHFKNETENLPGLNESFIEKLLYLMKTRSFKPPQH